MLLPEVVGALLGSLPRFFVQNLVTQFSRSKARWRALLFAAFLPPFVIFSAVNLKEIVTAFSLGLTSWFPVIVRRYTERTVGPLISLSLLLLVARNSFSSGRCAKSCYIDHPYRKGVRQPTASTTLVAENSICSCLICNLPSACFNRTNNLDNTQPDDKGNLLY